jgi:hypothetical protein
MLKDIFQPLVEIDHHIMSYPLVCVVDDFPGSEVSVAVPLGIIVPQQHVLLDDGGDLRVAMLSADLGSGLGMIAVAAQTGGLGDVVEEGAADHQVEVGLGAIWGKGCESALELFRQAGNYQGVVADIGQHAVLFHQADTLGQRGKGRSGLLYGQRESHGA